MNKDSLIYYEEEERNLAENLPRINSAKVYEMMKRNGVSLAQLSRCVEMSVPLIDLGLRLEIFPADKIDALASCLLIDKGELF